MKKLLVLLLFVPMLAVAKPHQLSWTWPVDTCDGAALSVGELIEAELIYSLVHMSMPSDGAGPCAEPGDPEAPPGAITVPISMPDTTVTLNLQPGQTYYARIRVSAYLAGNWSAWSAEATFTVPYGRPNRVIFTFNGLQYEYDLIDGTKLNFRGDSS